MANKIIDPLDEMWEELGRDLMKGGDESEANRLLAKGIPVYYVEEDYEGDEIIKKYPDDHKEIIVIERGLEIVVRQLP